MSHSTVGKILLICLLLFVLPLYGFDIIIMIDSLLTKTSIAWKTMRLHMDFVVVLNRHHWYSWFNLTLNEFFCSATVNQYPNTINSFCLHQTYDTPCDCLEFFRFQNWKTRWLITMKKKKSTTVRFEFLVFLMTVDLVFFLVIFTFDCSGAHFELFLCFNVFSL